MSRMVLTEEETVEFLQQRHRIKELELLAKTLGECYYDPDSCEKTEDIIRRIIAWGRQSTG